MKQDSMRETRRCTGDSDGLPLNFKRSVGIVLVSLETHCPPTNHYIHGSSQEGACVCVRPPQLRSLRSRDAKNWACPSQFLLSTYNLESPRRRNQLENRLG